MKKSVTQFDLSAAFKALDEMEYPQVEGGILPNRVDLKESFGNRKLRTDVLIEDYYDINDNNDLEAAAEERENEVAKAKLARIEKIVDLDADSEDDLLTSYEGKVIIQCPQCMTLFYKNEEDIEADENNPDVVNINETCQHCGNTSGYMVIGKVAPVEESELDSFDTEDFEEEPEEEVEVEEETTEEEPAEDEDLDALDLDFDEEEETTEEETNESLNKAEIQKEVDKKHCSENDSENITLNEDLTEDEGEAAKQDELQAEHESPVLNESEIDDVINSVTASWDLGEACEGPECEEGYKGTPAERTTHLEYTDDNPADGKAVLPDNIEKQLTEGEECKDGECEKPLEECGDNCSIEDAIKNILVKESLNEAIAKAALIAVNKKTGEVKTKEFSMNATIGQSDQVIKAREQAQADFLKELGPDWVEGDQSNFNKYTKESLNKAEVQADVDKKHCAENDSENLTLNEAADEEVIEDEVVEDEVAEEPVEETEEADIEETEEKEELPEVDFTTSEVKEVAEEVANAVAEPVEDEEAAEEQAEEIKEIVDEKVADAVEEKIEAEETPVDEEQPADEEEIPAEEVVDETEVIEEPVEEGLDSEKELEGFVPVDENLTEEAKEEVSDAEFNKLVNSADFEKMLNDPNALEECGVNKVFENIDEADEKAFEECITEALCETYENVKSFTLDECALKDNKFIVEGTINFNSGKTRKTQYIFESAAKTEDKAILEGYNKALSEDGNFRVNCLLKESCLVPQSMSYNYKIENNLVEGLATRK